MLRNYICSTHVHDNNKDKDTHLWPGEGTIDWKQAMELLRSAPRKLRQCCWNLGEDEKVNPLEKLQRDIRQSWKQPEELVIV